VTARVDRVNFFLQEELRRRGVKEVAAVEAARWLEAAGVLGNSDSRPGLPLRNMLRAGQITGAEQRPPTSHGRWYISGVGNRASGGSDLGAATNSRHKRSPAPRASSDDHSGRAARRRRERAARKYQPGAVKLLLVAEAPPSALDRYFYFGDVTTQDSLFRYVARAILRTEPMRSNKAELLARLRERGVFLIDLKLEPVDVDR
jgi:hypothetical protein